MGEIVNLRTVRKRKSREDAARAADENRIRHGRSKADKLRGRDEARKLQAHLDGHRRSPPGDEPGA
jgi:hypothetical protein